MSDSVFDNKVERASREMKDSGASSSDLTRQATTALSSAMVATAGFEFHVSGFGSFSKLETEKLETAVRSAYFRRQTSGFKREFDPGSESTLAACLTHASRTRKSARTSRVANG